MEEKYERYQARPNRIRTIGGDQKQWIFPRVRLRREERRLIVATVIQLAAEAMFSHLYYGFGGKLYRQMEGYLHHSSPGDAGL